jgi:integrase
MASIYQNASGHFIVQWDVGRDRRGKRIRDSRTFDTEARAIAFKVELEDLRGGTGRDSLVARGIQWANDREAIGKISEKTAVAYREKIRAWGALLGSKAFKRITGAEIERAYAALAAGQTPSGRIPSPRTLHHYRTILATFFNHMEKKAKSDARP